ncbi:MAG: hypothetical protein H7Z74_17040 [Anaerolineae bacterium]|nr:hypothetical protein [Gemmatimonadaceae bacterium]
MDVLVLLEEAPDPSPVLARVDSVPGFTFERRGRDVVTLYGTPSTESLALALAAVVESRRAEGYGQGAFRHLGVWPGRGAVGDTAWRDAVTGELVTRDLDIPLAVLTDIALRLRDECGPLLQRLVAGLQMADWPEGMWRGITLTFDPDEVNGTALTGAGMDSLLDTVRLADGLSYEYEGD